MDIKKLNEKLDLILNEISDETKQSYLAKRQAQLDKAQAKLNRAKQMVAKSDKRQLSNIPDKTDLETAKKY